MPKVTVYDMTGKSVGEMNLSDAVFGIEPNAQLCTLQSLTTWPTSVRALSPL